MVGSIATFLGGRELHIVQQASYVIIYILHVIDWNSLSLFFHLNLAPQQTHKNHTLFTPIYGGHNVQFFPYLINL
jgi:hypothetical protein